MFPQPPSLDFLAPPIAPPPCCCQIYLLKHQRDHVTLLLKTFLLGAWLAQSVGMGLLISGLRPCNGRGGY